MISVILPVYNKAETLRASVESVLCQDDQDFELIIVDDGSTDGTFEVLKTYTENGKIRILRQPNGGVSMARNRGIGEARGEMICFLDGDDVWLPDHLSMISMMADRYPMASLFMTGCRLITPDGTESDNAAFLPKADAGQLVEDYCAYTETIGGEMILYTIAIGVRRDALCRSGLFQPGVRIGEDYDLWLRILVREKAAFCNRVTAIYHREHSTATAGGNMDVDWFFQTREAAILADASLPVARREHLRTFMDRFRIRKARHLLMAGRRSEAKDALRAVRVTPKNRRAYGITKLCMLVPPPILRAAYRRMKKGM